MGIRACARAPQHFGSTACMVYMAVRENQMPDVIRIVARFLHRFEYGFSFIWPSSINQEHTIICYQQVSVDHSHFNCHRWGDICKTLDIKKQSFPISKDLLIAHNRLYSKTRTSVES